MRTDNSTSSGGRAASPLVRLERAVSFYRNLSLALAVITIVLLAVLIIGRGQRFGRAIRIDDEPKPICLVNDERAAELVHDRLLSEARGDLPGDANIEEHWEDVSWPVEDNQVLSVAQALEALRPRVHVVVEAAIIEVDGVRGVVMPSQQAAEDVLDAVKAQYVKEGDTIVGQQVFLEDVKISPGQARVGDVTREIGEAVKKLSQAKREAQSYTVKTGDFPEKIASDHHMQIADLWDLNPGLRGRTIHPGEKLKVSAPHAGITVKTVKEVTREVTLDVEVEQIKSASVPRGETRVVPGGAPPRKLLREQHTYHNDKLVEKKVTSGQIIDPGTPRRILVGTGERPAAGAPSQE